MLLTVVRQRSFFPSQSGWRQGMFAPASCRNTSGLDAVSPRCLAGNHYIHNLARMNLTNDGVSRLLRAPTSGTALLMPDTMQDNGELSGQRHPCFAITRSLGGRARPILQARGSLDPRQDNDSGLAQQSTSERIAAPRYSATAIDLARLILSRLSPRCAPTDRDRTKRAGFSTVPTYASADSCKCPARS